MSARLVDQPITERPKVVRGDSVAPYDMRTLGKPWVVAWRSRRRNAVCTMRFRTHAEALDRANRAAASNWRARPKQSDYALVHGLRACS